MIKLGDRYLPVVESRVAGWLQSYLTPADVLQFDANAWNHNLYHLAPTGYAEPPAIEIGSFYWPAGASRFAVGYFLADDDDMDALRSQAFTNDGPQPLTLTIDNRSEATDDATDTEITTEVFLLPPRPLSQITGENGLWLLTVVDERYFWWFKAADIVVNVGVTTYSTLISAIATALGVTITADTPNADYGLPSNRFTTRNQPLPLLLDAVCAACGLRISRGYDGSITAKTYANSATIESANAAKIDPVDGPFFPVAGGEFDAGDITKSVPDTVRVVFGRTDSGTYAASGYFKDVTLASLALTEFGSVNGFDGQKVLTGDLVATFSGGGSPTNDATLETYAERMAVDWYQWQLGETDESFVGVCDWTPSGLSHTIKFEYTVDSCLTRVMRDPWYDFDWGRFRRSDLEGERSWILEAPLNCTEVLACVLDEPSTMTVVTNSCPTFADLTFVTTDGYVSDVLLDGVSILGLTTPIVVGIKNEHRSVGLPNGTVISDPVCEEDSEACCSTQVTTACCDVTTPSNLYVTVNQGCDGGSGECDDTPQALNPFSFPITYNSGTTRWEGSYTLTVDGCSLLIEFELWCNTVWYWRVRGTWSGTCGDCSAGVGDWSECYEGFHFTVNCSPFSTTPYALPLSVPAGSGIGCVWDAEFTVSV